MSMNIYTTGSAEFLEIMLNASAMITSSGTSEDLARIGLMIGLLLLGFQAVFNGQGISFQKAGLLLVLYLIFYGPTTTAVIEDTTTGQARVVDNVPLGPTFVGSVISTVAYDITRVGEQAFSTPTMTDYGLFSSLTTISRVRDALRNPLALDSYVNYRKNAGWNLPRSVDEFLTFCTLNPIALREYQSIDDLYRASGAAGVFNAPLTSQFVYIQDGTVPGGQLMSCSQAQAVLNTALADVYTDLMEDVLARGFATERAAGKINTAGEVMARTDDAIQSMGISAKNAQGYTTMALIVPIFGDARVNALNHWQEQNAAMALRESLNQQEIQWAGKGDIFKHYMRPMIAFFEGLLYAMTPFMAFALVLGSPGLSVLGKYLILPLAVGLWMPLLSIVNAFTLWYAGAEIQAVFEGYDSTSEGFAMLQVLDLDQAISKALGIGGLLAASVPPLALFIVSGSAMVANGIMGQMTQGDKFKSEDVLPRAKNQAPVMDSTSSFTSDQMTQGVAVTGARAVAPKISASQSAEAAVESSRTNAETATSQLQQQLVAGSSQLNSSSEGRQTLAGLGQQSQAALGLSKNAQFNEASKTLQSHGITQNEIAQGVWGASIGFQAPLGAIGTKLEQSESFQKMSSEQQQQAREAVAQLSRAVQSNMSESTIYNSADSFNSSQQAMQQASNGEQIAKSTTAAKTAQEAYKYAASQKEAWSSRQDMDIGVAAASSLARSGLPREEAARQILDMAGKTNDDQQAIRTLIDSSTVRGVSADSNERAVAASMLHMMQSGRLDELIGSKFTPFDFNVSAGNASEFEGMQDNRIPTDHLNDRFNSKWSANEGGYTSEYDMSLSGREQSVESGKDIVSAAQTENDNVVAEYNQENLNAVPQMTMEKPDVSMNTTSPVVDGFKGIGNFDSSNTLIVGAKQIASPVINAVSDGYSKLQELSRNSKKPPSIDD
ncbi:MAG: conjugal transfer protein TraG N-terminal domain-containing protein [Pseudomonas sp.]|nr:conjugal transfer protein TraG N-terminal domain-containing protein [Pseudomonas sp.]